MKYELGVVNPNKSTQRTIVVELSDDQVAAAKASPDWMGEVQRLARPRMPKGFMFISCAVRAVANA
ncbi:hypothetical protein ACNJX9_17825 [Bradyrhizobium sp. DASA03076]|uniref:hypothetical protein n=1 Tax=Bradyrhizobium sp. BLXBL-03 TaxID=3395916 RepID=UPI003F7126F9